MRQLQHSAALLFHVFAVFFAMLTVSAPAADLHAWERISYPPLPIPDAAGENLMVMVGSGSRDEVPRLRFDVLWSARWGKELPATIADASRLAVRLHLVDGTIVLPQEDGHRRSWMGAGSMGVTWSLIYSFPWQKNALEEAWIELTLPGQTYWVELPYGFTRKPSDPLIANPKLDRPVFPPTMKTLGEKDRLVPWLSVEYDLGEIQNHWRLSLQLSNPFDAHAEAILYRDPGGEGKSMYRWKMDAPRTAMEFKLSGGRVIDGHASAIRLHEDGLRRSDNFDFNRFPDEGRDWGTLVIRVDKKAYECTVPSSLYKYTHGVTDPENPRLLPRPAPAR
jgi:hypothetical protein